MKSFTDLDLCGNAPQAQCHLQRYACCSPSQLALDQPSHSFYEVDKDQVKDKELATLDILAEEIAKAWISDRSAAELLEEMREG